MAPEKSRLTLVDIEPRLTQLLSETIRACLHPDMQIGSIAERPLPKSGFSGAQMRLFDVKITANQPDAPSLALLVKAAPLNERHALVTLYRQGQPAVPFCHTLDLVSEGPAPICMRYIQSDPNDAGYGFLRLAARELAAIHAKNLANHDLLTWAPPADRGFYEGGYVLKTWRDCWYELLKDMDFKSEFGQYCQPLETAAVDFLAAMGELWDEGKTLTLIHGDLHDGNVLSENGKPFIVDWGQAHYGSFYIDLPNLFSAEVIPFYLQALADLGCEIPRHEFMRRYRQAGRYVGFKYIAFTLSGWPDRNQPGSMVRAHLNNLINLAINGA